MEDAPGTTAPTLSDPELTHPETLQPVMPPPTNPPQLTHPEATRADKHRDREKGPNALPTSAAPTPQLTHPESSRDQPDNTPTTTIPSHTSANPNDAVPSPLPDQGIGGLVCNESPRLCIREEVRQDIHDSTLKGCPCPVPTHPPNRSKVQMRAVQEAGEDQTQGARAGCLPSEGGPSAQNIRKGASRESSCEQGPPIPRRAHRRSYAAGLAGEGIPAWLTHKINAHPEAGKEVWVTPAIIVAGSRKTNPRDSNKRRKAISTLGHTLTIPTPSERSPTGGSRPKRRAAAACKDKLGVEDQMRYWTDIEVVIPTACEPPRRLKSNRNKKVTTNPTHKSTDQGREGGSPPPAAKIKHQGKEGGIPPPTDKQTTQGREGGTPPPARKRPSQGREGGTPPPAKQRNRRAAGEGQQPLPAVHGAGPHPGEG